MERNTSSNPTPLTNVLHPPKVLYMSKVQIYTTNYCHYCKMAKELLKSKGIPFEEFDVTNDPQKREWLVQTTGLKTVPQIFIDGKSIGGYEDLKNYPLK